MAVAASTSPRRPPSLEFNWQIENKWTDSDGNIWYQTCEAITSGVSQGKDLKGQRSQALHKLSQSGTMWESMLASVDMYDSGKYPSDVSAVAEDYHVYNRTTEETAASQAYVPIPNEELYGTWTNEQYSVRLLSAAKSGCHRYWNEITPKISDSVPYEGGHVTRSKANGRMQRATFGTGRLARSTRRRSKDSSGKPLMS